MKTVIVHKSDFKDFPGLQMACFYYSASVIQYAKHFVIFGYDINPYEMVDKFDRFYSDNSYNRVLELAEENGMNLNKAKGLMDRLEMRSNKVLNILLNSLNYPKGHINRYF